MLFQHDFTADLRSSTNESMTIQDGTHRVVFGLWGIEINFQCPL
jgi:hypothetical protein